MNDMNQLPIGEFADYIVRKRFVVENHARFYVHWVEMFLKRPVQKGDTWEGEMRAFLEEIGRSGRYQEWQINQAA